MAQAKKFLKMGVSIAHYRQAIGIFNSNCARSNNKLYCARSNNKLYYARNLYKNAKFCEGNFDTRKPSDIFVHYIYCIAIFYIIIFMEICSLSTAPSSKNQEQIFYNSGNFISYTHTYATNYYLILYNNSMNIILLTHIVKKIFSNTKLYKTLISNGLNSMRSFLEISITLYVTSITLLLIVTSNCSLLNPGPKSIQSGADSVSVYQNINGLLAFSTLGQEHPSLNITKHTEFLSYIITYNADIIILNETWLKPSISDNEILPINNYNLFKLDRSSSSHPPDPVNPKKFKQNGGGILIGVKNSIDLKPKIVTSNVHAEILSITLALKGNKKI